MEPLQTLDLSKYKSPELVDTLAGLISIPKTTFKVFLTVLVVAPLILVMDLVLFLFSGISWAGWLGVLAYALTVGVVSGILVGLFLAIRAALGNLESLVLVVLDISRRVSEDYAQVSTGKIKMPGPTELIKQIVTVILVPSLEEAVARSFGLLAKPALWMYRGILGLATRYVIKKTDQEETTIERNTGQDTPGENEDPSAQETQSEKQQKIESYLDHAQGVTERMAGRIRWFAMLPVFALLALSILLMQIPVFVARFLFSAGSDS